MTALTLVHTSDWHLGHELAGHPRDGEHAAFLAWLLDQLDRQQADVLLVTGDIYDVANPPVSAMWRLYAFLAEAAARRPALLTVILGGNHDSAARIDLPAPLLDPARVRFVGRLPRRPLADAGGSEPDLDALMIPLPGPGGATAGWLAAVPFCRPGDLGAHSLATLYAAVADHGAARADGLPLVLSGHLHVAGGAVSELSERRIVVGGEEAEAAALFGCDAAYVALGHLHRAQTIAGACPIRYAGSPFPLSATERDYRHSISVVHLSPGAAADIAVVEIPRTVPFLALSGDLDTVVARIAALDLDDSLPPEARPFIEVTVTVEGPEPQLQARVLAALGEQPVRLTRIVRQTLARDGAAADPLARRDLEELRPEAVFAALHAARHGGHAPSDELALAFARLLVDVNTDAEPA
jgi:DNA repair protein SbcD/Mre11